MEVGSIMRSVEVRSLDVKSDHGAEHGRRTSNNVKIINTFSGYSLVVDGGVWEWIVIGLGTCWAQPTGVTDGQPRLTIRMGHTCNGEPRRTIC
jgi:hypothetical protein